MKTFCRIQNLHISQTEDVRTAINEQFCRIQNLHISQTRLSQLILYCCFVEFKIYISLKPAICCVVYFKVLQNSKFTYLSNKEYTQVYLNLFCRIQNLHISQTRRYWRLQPLKFCRIQNLHISQTVEHWQNTELSFVEFKIYISLKQIFKDFHLERVLQNSKFTYLSNKRQNKGAVSLVLQNSKFTYLSNKSIDILNFFQFCRIQNLHISQTTGLISILILRFVEFKIYISLKQSYSCSERFESFVEFKIYISLKQYRPC